MYAWICLLVCVCVCTVWVQTSRCAFPRFICTLFHSCFCAGVSILHGVASTARPQCVWENEDKPLTGRTLVLNVFHSGKLRINSMILSFVSSVSQLQTTEWEHVSSQWLRVEAELLRERAVFGPGPGVLLSQDWVQESAEGPNRTKLRIRRKAMRQSKRV